MVNAIKYIIIYLFTLAVSKMFKKFINKKTVTAGCVTGLAMAYIYDKHNYEKELFNQFNYLLQNETKLSGVYLQQRQPWNFFWYITWALPYHQSLKIVQKDGTIRHVGLGRTDSNIFSRETGFVLHEGEKYIKLNGQETSIPIECWVDYKRKFGHFPSNINIEELNKITLTKKEAGSNDSVYRETFGRLTKDLNNDIIFVSCRSSVMYAIREEELRRTKTSE